MLIDHKIIFLFTTFYLSTDLFKGFLMRKSYTGNYEIILYYFHFVLSTVIAWIRIRIQGLLDPDRVFLAGSGFN